MRELGVLLAIPSPEATAYGHMSSLAKDDVTVAIETAPWHSTAAMTMSDSSSACGKRASSGQYAPGRRPMTEARRLRLQKRRWRKKAENKQLKLNLQRRQQSPMLGEEMQEPPGVWWRPNVTNADDPYDKIMK